MKGFIEDNFLDIDAHFVVNEDDLYIAQWFRIILFWKLFGSSGTNGDIFWVGMRLMKFWWFLFKYSRPEANKFGGLFIRPHSKYESMKIRIKSETPQIWLYLQSFTIYWIVTKINVKSSQYWSITETLEDIVAYDDLANWEK